MATRADSRTFGPGLGRESARPGPPPVIKLAAPPLAGAFVASSEPHLREGEGMTGAPQPGHFHIAILRARNAGKARAVHTRVHTSLRGQRATSDPVKTRLERRREELMERLDEIVAMQACLPGTAGARPFRCPRASAVAVAVAAVIAFDRAAWDTTCPLVLTSGRGLLN